MDKVGFEDYDEDSLNEDTSSKITVDDLSENSSHSENNVCMMCNSIFESEGQRDSHEKLCTGRTSFMRLANSHPEYHPEKEVLWILRKYIEKQKEIGNKVADMPIGSKYLPYAESINRALCARYYPISFDILHKTDTTIMIRGNLS